MDNLTEILKGLLEEDRLHNQSTLERYQDPMISRDNKKSEWTKRTEKSEKNF
jgi:hypothetical protein